LQYISRSGKRQLCWRQNSK